MSGVEEALGNLGVLFCWHWIWKRNPNASDVSSTGYFGREEEKRGKEARQNQKQNKTTKVNNKKVILITRF